MYPFIAYVPILASFMQLYIIRSSGNIVIADLPSFISLYGLFPFGDDYCVTDKHVTIHPLG
jgi:hypothetical protein